MLAKPNLATTSPVRSQPNEPWSVVVQCGGLSQTIMQKEIRRVFPEVATSEGLLPQVRLVRVQFNMSVRQHNLWHT